jgi:ATP-dependent Clp protease adapter protein ClpS
MSPSVQSAPTKRKRTRGAARQEDICQVVLYNDDHNLASFVVMCLMRVFGHPAGLATKIMVEADRTGRAVAEVEARSAAVVHKQQLESFGLTAEVEAL